MALFVLSLSLTSSLVVSYWLSLVLNLMFILAAPLGIRPAVLLERPALAFTTLLSGWLAGLLQKEIPAILLLRQNFNRRAHAQRSDN